MEKPRIYIIPLSSVYPLYLQKAEKKGRTKAEVDQIIFWLTGYDETSLKQQLSKEVSMETFFQEAPSINPDASLIKGVICRIRVEEIKDETTRNIRYLDKLVDELAKGKPMAKILRKP